MQWGVAMSAFQTEGYTQAGKKGPSIWDEFVEKKDPRKLVYQARSATEFYKRYPNDLDLMQRMNCNNFRFSTAWTRIIPEGYGKVNSKGISFYDRFIDDCLERAINPWLTAYHWDLPLALEQKGGWTNRSVIDWFCEYLEVLVKYFGDRIENWMVLNEPAAFTGLGYFLGIHAPGKKGIQNFLPAAHHTALAQAEGGRLLKSLLPKSKVGSCMSYSPIEPSRNKNKDSKAAMRVDALLNRFFLEPLLGLSYPIEDLKALQEIEKYIKTNDLERLAFNMDFIGLQNYSREVVQYSFWTPYVKAKLISAKKRKRPVTAMNWENYPAALSASIKELMQYPNLPDIVVTECGIALEDEPNEKEKVKDNERVEFLESSISSLLEDKAIQEKVKGYFVWSFTDNFEWAEGNRPRFGLVYVNYKNQKRIPKDSFYWFQKFLSES